MKVRRKRKRTRKEKEKEGENIKRGLKGRGTPETAQKLFFLNVTRNREPIEAKKSDSEHPRKEKGKKEKKKGKKKGKKGKRKEGKKDRNYNKKQKKNKKGKKSIAETTKMDHLRIYTFAWRILESRPRMCGFLGCKVPLLDVIILQGIRRGRLPFFPQRGTNFFRMWTFHQGKREGPPAREQRGNCEGTARTSFLSQRHNYYRNAMKREEMLLLKNVSNQKNPPDELAHKKIPSDLLQIRSTSTKRECCL